ncbi:hypothetical protein ACFFHH_24365 [Cytobacillus solani]|uniref:Uncharacterized protein n=1 Tax=Cytobacillus solani TaxID=1637975 RepID=A0A0Q3U376_9BACI|nr:hypothetical protein [Cytobacillus solani]KOP77682.1 hypothetical protein AMS60_19185 [Bacillus sp. FJAT-21945]KQL17522.1 hypothetical protein AN957_01960 [Cytobacillus solani]
MEEKKVYIIFTDTGTLFTKLIKLYTKQPLNHVSISFDKQLTNIFSFGRKKPYNPFIGGFVRERIAEGLFKKARCEIYSYSLSEEEYEQMQTKVRQIEAKKDLYKYNFLGLIAIMLRYNLKRKNAFFCSQFVATILNEKKGMLDKSPSQCTPQDLLAVNKLELVFKGNLVLYPHQASEKMIEHDFSFGKPMIYKSPDFS